MVIMFKVEEEVLYIYKKVERDYVEAFQAHTNNSNFGIQNK
jgi:hypothetical protein